MTRAGATGRVRRVRRGREGRPYLGAFVGMGGMATVAFLDLGTAGVAPWWVTTLLVLSWLVLFAVACRWFMSHPRRVPLLPTLLFVAWLATILYGTRALGWS